MHAGELQLRALGVAESKGHVGQSDGDGGFVRTQRGCAAVHALRQRVLVDAHQNVGGVEVVFGGGDVDGRDARLSETKGDLLLGVGGFAFFYEQAAKGETNLEAILIGTFERTSVDVHRLIATAEDAQRVGAHQQNFVVFSTGALR